MTKQQLKARGRMGSYAIAQGRNDHFYTPTLIDSTNPSQSVTDNLDSIQATLLNSNTAFDTKMAELDAKIAALEAFEPWPVGCVYIAVDNINPRDKFGYGNWALTSGGRALVGAGGYGKVLGETGGQFNAALSEAHMPAHKHDVSVGNLTQTVQTDVQGGNRATSTGGEHSHKAYFTTSNNIGFPVDTLAAGSINTQLASPGNRHATAPDGSAHSHTVNIDHGHNVNISHGHTVGENIKGSGAAFNIEQPYFVVNVWYRVS